MKCNAFFFALYCLLCSASLLFAQPLTGYKTIGGTSPNYATFGAATAALSANGVGTGGVTFLVRPGIYSETVSLSYLATMGAGNPIVFRNDTNFVGTVQISPNVITTGLSGVALAGVRYVTFNGISVIDTSTGTYCLQNGYWLTNSSATQGAQYCTFKNATIRLRIHASYATYGVYQYRAFTPTSANGTQSYNTYLNLKISKVSAGVYLGGYNTTYPDASIEVGSDSSGINYANRFTIGAMVNDTIGGAHTVYGVNGNYLAGISIHDVDITNLKSISGIYNIYGIVLTNPNSVAGSSPVVVYNNRIFNLQGLYLPTISYVYGIYIMQYSTNGVCRFYNNMIYNLQQNATVTTTATCYTYGIYCSSPGNSPAIVNNTIILNQTGTQNFSSSCMYLPSTSVNDTIFNNILANLGSQSSTTPYHMCIYTTVTAAYLKSNDNCFYVPNSTGGYIGYSNSSVRTTLANWRSALTPNPDTNSVSGDPFLIDTLSNPHIRLSSSSPVSNIGTPFSWITTDIDGENRSATTPDIGADEGPFKELVGTKTIGGTSPDYATFAAATAALVANGVGPGGVTFSVRSGEYNEMVTVPAFPNMGASNPVVFQKASGNPQISPVATGQYQSGVKLIGCQYVTFDGINLVDFSNGTYSLAYGYRITNASSEAGAQHNIIRNASITMRIDAVNAPYGICQSSDYRPTSLAGTQSYNSYLNLKIHKVETGVDIEGYYVGSYFDTGTEIGSDSVGVNYANRFTIGSATNDTIGGPYDGYGIYVDKVNGISIHDIDITNMKVTIANRSLRGMYINAPNMLPGSSPSQIYNNRIFGFQASYVSDIKGIYLALDGSNVGCRIYNNMIYDLQQTATINPTSNYYVYGIHARSSTSATPTIVNNTIVLNQSGTQNFSSACLQLESMQANDTLKNNIFANLGWQSSPVSQHIGVLNFVGTAYFQSDYNCFYIPNSLGGFIGYNNGAYRSTLAAWQSSYISNPDLHSVVGDPVFTNPYSTPYNFHILPYQPVASIIDNAGTPFPWMITDIDGENRTTLPDIGADQGDFGGLLSGVKTIGGSYPDYPDFYSATSALTAQGVGAGGVTFLVRPGIYPEMVTVRYGSNMGVNNPVVFRNDTNFVGTVQISPPPPPASTHGVELFGCQYVTFDGINVVDTSSGLTGLSYGYIVMNSSGTQGAQHNTIKNATIRMKILAGAVTYGVNQCYGSSPTSTTGSQSYNRYLNLKISKVSTGVYIYGHSDFPDAGTEIGSDSTGFNYGSRFVIGAMTNDTIGGARSSYGINAWNTNGLSIHDIDITNIKTYSSSYSIYGISSNVSALLPGSSPTLIYNNRIFNLRALATTTYSTIFGIQTAHNASNGTMRIYNNMIYDLQEPSITTVTNVAYVIGIHNNGRTPNIVNNTIVLNQTGTQNYTSYCIDDNGGYTNPDTIQNNIFANLGYQTSATPSHMCIIMSNGPATIGSDYNCFYVPNSLGGYIGYNGSYRADLASWRTAPGNPDAHSVSGNPQLINTATSPYNVHAQTMQVNSVIDNAGRSYPWINTDIDGEARSTTPDIGADEGVTTYIPLTANPTSLNFIGTRPHKTDSLLVCIKHTTSQSFTYTTLTGASGTYFTKRVVDTDSNTVAGDSLKIWVRFSPDSIITYADTLRLTFQAPCNPITIPLCGLGVGSYVSLPGTSLNFGNSVLPGQNTSIDLPVLVSGNDSLRNARWITIPPTAPFYVLPNPLPSIAVGYRYTASLYFAPTATGVFTAQIGLVSNAVNGDTLRIGVSAFSQTMPVAPGLTINVNGDNALLNWTRPDTTVQRYLVYFRNTPTVPWQFLVNTIGYNAISFTHSGVIRFSPQMYYQVTAWYGTSTDSFDRIIREIPVGTPKDEVMRRLSLTSE